MWVAIAAMQMSNAFSIVRGRPERLAQTCPVKVWILTGTPASAAAVMASKPAFGVKL
jgi:hypothetical protein